MARQQRKPEPVLTADTIMTAPQERLRPERIEDLTREDLHVLKTYADMKIFGNVLQGCSAEDLVNQAIFQTMDGTRPHDPQTDLIGHLRGSIRSIVSGLCKKAARQEPIGENPLSAPPAFIQQELQAKQFIETLESRLTSVTARRILHLTLDGWSRAEIERDLKIRSNVYLAAKKKIQREFRKLMDMSKGRYAAQKS